MLKAWTAFFILLFFLISSESVLGYEKTIFHDSFENFSQWHQVFNEQQAQPGVPCRGISSPEMAWQIINGRATLNINHSSPCKVVIQPQGIAEEKADTSGVEFEMWLNRVDVDRNWLVHWQDNHNYFGFHLFNNGIYPEKYVDGKAYQIFPEFFFYAFLPNIRYRINLEHNYLTQQTTLFINGTPLVRFQENVDDPKITGPPGLVGSVGAARDFSYSEYDSFRFYTITDEVPLALDVPLIMQTDPQWSDQEYDRASAWSPKETNIGRWGCALTSAVMVFRYFGLDTFPDGKVLTPATVNTWLQNQSDGYVGDGLLNWRALSRLSQEIAESLNTPTLEMSFLAKDVNLKEQMWQLLAENIPPILHLPEHFVVAHGVEDFSKLLIRDPSFSNTTQDVEKVLSARVFTPSHTDLSALTLYVPTGVQIDDLPGWTQILESTPDSQQTYQVFDLSKPTNDLYGISISNPGILTHSIFFLAYDQSGNVLKRTEIIPAQAKSRIFTITRVENQPWQILSPSVVWQPLSTGELSFLLTEGQIRSPWILREFVENQSVIQSQTNLVAADSNMSVFQARYQHWINKKWMSATAYDQIWLNHTQQLRYLFP